MVLRVASRVLASALILSAAVAGAAPEPPPETVAQIPRRIPAAEFAYTPQLSRPKLSPDGLAVVGRMELEGALYLAVHSVKDGLRGAIRVPEKMDLRWYRWAGNGRILFSAAQTVAVYNDEYSMTQLFSYDIASKAITRVGPRNHGLEGDDLLHVDPGGSWVLLSIAPSIYDWQGVLKIDLATNKSTSVVPARSGISEWYADDDGVVRAGIGFEENAWTMIYRKTAAEPFRKLGRARYDDEDAGYDMLRFASRSDEGYVLSNKETGRYALYKFNYATKQTGEKIFESPTNDLNEYSTDRASGALESLTYTDDRDRILWFNPAMKALQAQIDEAVGGREAWIVSRATDAEMMLVWVGASNDPGATYYFQPQAGKMQVLIKGNPKLRRSEMPVSRYVSYRARDGLEIHGYLTLPLGREAKGLPLVVMPHGGPYGVRDNGDFDPDVQLLANRGYAVLQPNYRGSDGYGLAFYEKGEGQWGRQMQDDLDDGMDWLVAQGIADAKRVCIVGSSYGGYAALWGATRNPERYRCAASFAGVSDLGKQLRYQISFQISKRYRKNWRRVVTGGPGFDTAIVSPIATVDRLRIPVLIAHGEDDQTVPPKQSKQYVEALRKAGKPFEFYSYKEGHGFSDPKNQTDWLERLDAFLAKYNPA